MQAIDLNLRHLRAFGAIMESGSMTAAARQIHLTQPAITQGIAKLERQLGAILFERQPGQMVPTPTASLLAPRAHATLRLIGLPRATAAQVRAFLALAASGSYSGAARETGLSEASLHRAVGDLALVAGHALVERRGKGVVLTARGTALARRFRLAVAELRSARAELAAQGGNEREKIVIGAMPLSRARLLPSAIVAFNRRFPHVEIVVVEGGYAELVGPLRDGGIDIMIGAERAGPPSDLVQQALFDDRLVVLGRAGHPLAALDRGADMAELAQYPWVVPGAGTPLRHHWQSMFENAGMLPPPVPVECGSVMTVRQILVETDFLTLLSPDQVSVELEAGKLALIGALSPGVTRVIALTVRTDWRPTASQAAFIGVTLDEAGKLRGHQNL